MTRRIQLPGRARAGFVLFFSRKPSEVRLADLEERTFPLFCVTHLPTLAGLCRKHGILRVLCESHDHPLDAAADHADSLAFRHASACYALDEALGLLRVLKDADGPLTTYLVAPDGSLTELPSSTLPRKEPTPMSTPPTLKVPSKSDLLGEITYDAQSAVDFLVRRIREERNLRPGGTCASLSAAQVREACPDVPRGGSDPGGTTWQAIVAAFGTQGIVVKFHEGMPTMGDTVTFS